MSERFFLSNDNDGHLYLIPADKREAFEEWREIPEDDEAAWEAPEFARRVDGDVSSITFCLPRSIFDDVDEKLLKAARKEKPEGRPQGHRSKE